MTKPKEAVVPIVCALICLPLGGYLTYGVGGAVFGMGLWFGFGAIASSINRRITAAIKDVSGVSMAVGPGEPFPKNWSV